MTRSALLVPGLALGLVSLASACGTSDPNSGGTVDCSMVTGTDTFVVGLEKMGASGAIDFKMMSAEPSPPARGDNTWVIQLNTMSSGVVGSPIDGATLQVTPFMPAHGHGTPIPVGINPGPSAGQYELTPVNLWMPGVWETTIEATSGATTDSAVYRFCIPS
jgi:hypothetical protein